MTTYNTGNPIGSTDPRDLYDNAQNFDFALNSLTEAIWLDRFGVGRRTWYGLEVMVADAAASYGIITLSGVSFTTGATVNLNEALLNTANNTYYKWTGGFPAGGKIVPPSSTPESTGGIGPGKWLSVGDTVLRSDLASNEVGKGASLVTDTTSGRTVQEELDTIRGLVTVNISDYPDLKAAIAALPSTGGTVLVPQGNFYAGIWDAASNYMNKPNVHIKGVKKPSLNADASALVGGSIIEGRFNVFADNFSVSDIGFDMGKSVCDARYPGLNPATDYLRGGTWDAFAHGQPSQTSPLADRKNFYAVNVIGLMYNSQAVGHGILLEGINGGFVDNITGIYGVHGVVFKVQNMKAGTVEGHMTSVDGVIFKSDTYAMGGDIQVGSISTYRYAPNCTPHTIPATSTAGVYLNPETANFSGPIQIGRIAVRDAQYGVLGGNANSGKVGADVSISELNVDGVSGNTDNAFFCANFGTFPRMHIGSINATNVKNFIYAKYNDASSTGNAQLTIGSAKLTICESTAIVAAGYMKLSIGTLEVFGALTAYYIENTARVDVGKETLTGITTKWGLNPPIVGTGWSNFGSGNSSLEIFYNGYRVNLKGLIGASGAGSLIMTLPAYLRPKESMRFIAYKNTGTRTFCLIGVSSDGLVTIDDGAAPTDGAYISLDGIGWESKQ